MDNEILEILKQIQTEQKETLKQIQTEQRETLKQIQTEQQETNKKLGNIETEIKDFKNQFTDFEGKSANNHVEVISRIDNMQKDLNTMELVTSKNWNDIAQLKAVK